MKKIFNTAPPNAFFKLEIPGEREDSLLAVSSVAIAQKYVTVLSAEQASLLASEPPVLNLPAGRYIFLGGSIELSPIGQVDLDFGGGDIAIVDSNGAILAKQPSGNAVEPGGCQALIPYTSNPCPPASGPYSLIVDADTASALDGSVKITLLVVPI